MDSATTPSNRQNTFTGTLHSAETDAASLDNGATWIELPEPSAADVNKANNFYKRFTGDPAYEYIAGSLLNS